MPEKPPSTARLEAFSDGVIAVIITIMVLELKVPSQNGAAGLYALVPILLIYLLSFAFTAIYWINHQHLLHRISHADRVVLYANLVFLFFLSLLPFSTSYVLEKDIDAFATSAYAVLMLAIGFSFFLLRIAIHRNLRRTGELERADTAEKIKHVVSLVLFLLSIPLAYVSSRATLILIAVVTFIWILPDLATRKTIR
jgi:uncharacterized membrane protein